MPSSEGTEAILLAIASHIPRNAQFNSEKIGHALHGMLNMAPSEGTEAILGAITPHIQHAAQLNPQEIAHALHRLKPFKDSPSASRILCTLADHLSTLSAFQIYAYDSNVCKSTARRSDVFHAEVLNSLLPWLHNSPQSASCQAALDVLFALENHFPESSYAKVLLKQPGRQSLLLQ